MVIVKAMELELIGDKVKSESIAELQKLHAFNQCHLQFLKNICKYGSVRQFRPIHSSITVPPTEPTTGGNIVTMPLIVLKFVVSK